MDAAKRLECECGFVCTQAEMDHVQDPNPLPGEPVTTWLVCPRCRTPVLSQFEIHIGASQLTQA